MRFTRLRLRNYKCYESLDVELTPGVTVVHGVNGSGKSSLLNACFFGLYGTDALEAQQNLESIITKDKDVTEVELWFEHAGNQYQLEREIRHSGTQVSHQATLQTPNGHLDGITEIEQEIKDLLRMDAEAFLNCAFVRQGDIARLLTATPSERQLMIDELLQLGKLDAYQERMDMARVGVDRVRRAQETKLSSVRDEISELEEADLFGQLETLTDEIEEIEAEQERLEEKREDVAESMRDLEEEREAVTEVQNELQSKVDTVEEKQAELAETRERIESLDDEIEELHSKRQRIFEEIVSTQESVGVDIPEPDSIEEAITHVDDITEANSRVSEQIEEKTEEITELREQAQAAAATNSQLAEQLTELQKEADEEETQAEEFVAEADEKKAAIEEREDKLAAKEARIQEKKDEFSAPDIPEFVGFGDADAYEESVADRVAELEAREREVEAEYTRIEERVSHAETLLAEGKCPECGQTVEDAPEVDGIEEDREKLEQLEADLRDIRESLEEVRAEQERAEELRKTETEIAQLESETESIRELLAEQESNIESLRDSAERLFAAAEEKREKRSSLHEEKAQKEQIRDEYIASVEELTQEKSALVDEKQSLETLLEAVREGEQVVAAVREKQSRREEIEALRSEQEAQIEALNDEIEDLKERVDPAKIEELDAEYEARKQEHGELTDQLSELSSELEELTEERGRVRSSIERLETKREEQEEIEQKRDAVASVVEECEELELLYSELQTDLRQQNITQLEQLVNEIFSLVYQNDSYSRIELTGEYELSIYEKSGEALDPTELSGGEKALFNLSLRCAIYQLLSEGIDGKAPLPPLILDEPTVHLDEEHINRISDVVDRMRQLGVDQTIVVSHEPEIVDSADERIEVTQNPSTNRSSVNVESTDLLAGLPG